MEAGIGKKTYRTNCQSRPRPSHSQKSAVADLRQVTSLETAAARVKVSGAKGRDDLWWLLERLASLHLRNNTPAVLDGEIGDDGDDDNDDDLQSCQSLSIRDRQGQS